MKPNTEKLIAHKKEHHLSVRHSLLSTRIVCDDCGNIWSSKWDRLITMLSHILATALIVVLITAGLFRFWWTIENDILSFLVYAISALPVYFLVFILLNALHASLLRCSKDLSKHIDELL